MCLVCTNWIVNVPTQRPYLFCLFRSVRFDFEYSDNFVDADSNVNFKWIFINNVYRHGECWKAHEHRFSGDSCYFMHTYIYMTHGSPISDDYYIIAHRESVCNMFCFSFSSIMSLFFFPVAVVSSHFINAKTKAKIVICLCRVECKYETWKHKNAHSVLPLPTSTSNDDCNRRLLLLHRKCP